MLKNLIRLISEGFKNPSRIPTYLRNHFRRQLLVTLHGGRILNYWDINGTPRYNALMIQPLDKLFIKKDNIEKRTNDYFKSGGTLQVLNELGFNVDIYNSRPRANLLQGWWADRLPDQKQYDLLIGNGSKFIDYTDKVEDDTIIILQKGGEYWKDRISSILDRIDRLQHRKKIQYNDYRLGPLNFYDGVSRADGILLWGGKFNQQKICERFPNMPIRSVPVSHPTIGPIDLQNRDYATIRRNFIFFAGNGPLLKGLDLTLEAFKNLEDMNLYVAGSHNFDRYSQFKQLYENELNNLPNIIDVGWIDMFSDEYFEICRSCGYQIYPTATDTSPPGAVVAMMWQGVVPIVSEPAQPDLNKWYIELPNCEINTIREHVLHAADKNPAELAEMAKHVSSFAIQHHDEKVVKQILKLSINQLLVENGFYESRNV